jgi:hypothetical protein
MDDVALHELGTFTGFVVGTLVGATLIRLLRQHIRHSRLRRAFVWFSAWGTAALVGVMVSVMIEGTHQVARIRGQGGIRDFTWTQSDAIRYALIIGALAFVAAFFLPWTSAKHSEE